MSGEQTKKVLMAIYKKRIATTKEISIEAGVKIADTGQYLRILQLWGMVKKEKFSIRLDKTSTGKHVPHRVRTWSFRPSAQKKAEGYLRIGEKHV